MDNYRDKLMNWKPDMPGFTSDDKILAVGLQCRSKRFPLADVIAWLGAPDKASGNAASGQLLYFYPGPNQVATDDEVAYMFDVLDGKVVDFGSIARYRNNAIRPDGKTHFNILDTMVEFYEADFK